MINTPTYLSIPTVGSTASKSTTGLDTANLYSPGALFPAEHLNYFLNGTTNNGNVSQTALLAMLTEAQNYITTAGFALDPADNYQTVKATIAQSRQIGSIIYSEVELTPAINVSGSATYNPIIKRYDSDHDITSAQAPLLVTKYRAEVAKINVAGSVVSSWTGTVSGSTITFAANATNLALVNMYTYEALANGWLQTQAAGFTALYTGTAQRCINVNGTDYAVTGSNPGAYTITVSGTPSSGSQTCIPYTYRIAGSSTSVRLPKISGFVGVAAQDYDGVVVAGWRKMDQMQGHYHNPLSPMTNFVGFGTGAAIQGASLQGAANTTGAPVTDGTNGTPRTGKTTDPRTIGLYVYTHAGVLLS